jgi:hypothetical protein
LIFLKLTITMKVAYALSPGGLLLPYHLGALASLEYHKRLGPDNIVGGSSAGAIATMVHGCGLRKQDILETTITVSDQCEALGGARGRLLPLLERQMETLVGPEEFLHLQEERDVGIAYTQVFPSKQSYLQTEFANRQDLFRAVSFSCMFPFFATNWPCALDTSQGGVLPRLMVDGFFSVPRDRFGCPDFEDQADRTVAISVFPKDQIQLDAFEAQNCISPSTEDISLEDLFRIATQASSREELTKVYDLGFQDAERWCYEEAQRERDEEKIARDVLRKVQ